MRSYPLLLLLGSMVECSSSMKMASAWCRFRPLLRLISNSLFLATSYQVAVGGVGDGPFLHGVVHDHARELAGIDGCASQGMR